MILECPRGAGQKLRNAITPDLRPSHSGIFFRRPRIRAAFRIVSRNAAMRSRKSRVFSSAAFDNHPLARADRWDFGDLFSPPPGAGKSLEGFEPGPVRPQHKLFWKYPRTFFLIRSVA